MILTRMTTISCPKSFVRNMRIGLSIFIAVVIKPSFVENALSNNTQKMNVLWLTSMKFKGWGSCKVKISLKILIRPANEPNIKTKNGILFYYVFLKVGLNFNVSIDMFCTRECVFQRPTASWKARGQPTPGVWSPRDRPTLGLTPAKDSSTRPPANDKLSRR